MKASTDIRNTGVLAMAAELNGGVIRMYGSTTSLADALTKIPLTANAAIGDATLLCTISVDGGGTGINMDTTPSDGILAKDSSEAWLGDMVASGWFSFLRFSSLADTGAESTTISRVQLTVGTIGTEVIVSSAYKAVSEEQRIDQFYLALPTA